MEINSKKDIIKYKLIKSTPIIWEIHASINDFVFTWEIGDEYVDVIQYQEGYEFNLPDIKVDKNAKANEVEAVIKKYLGM